MHDIKRSPMLLAFKIAKFLRGRSPPCTKITSNGHRELRQTLPRSPVSDCVFLHSMESPSQPIIQIELEPGCYEFVVPFQAGVRTISLRKDQSVACLISAIYEANPSIKSLRISSITLGKRLAQSSPIRVLADGDYAIEIDGTTYLMNAVLKSSHLGYHPAAAPGDETLQKVCDYLEGLRMRGVSKSTMADYLAFSEGADLDRNTSLACLHALHSSGVILFFENSPELSEVIFLNPGNVAAAMRHSLSPMESAEETRKQIRRLQEEQRVASQCYAEIDAKARKYAKLAMRSMLGVLLLQWLVFARLTWWDYSWNEIEPATYFVTVIETIMLKYLYYLVKEEDYSNRDMSAWIYSIALKWSAKKYKLSDETRRKIEGKLDELRQRQSK